MKKAEGEYSWFCFVCKAVPFFLFILGGQERGPELLCSLATIYSPKRRVLKSLVCSLEVKGRGNFCLWVDSKWKLPFWVFWGVWLQSWSPALELLMQIWAFKKHYFLERGCFYSWSFIKNGYSTYYHNWWSGSLQTEQSWKRKQKPNCCILSLPLGHRQLRVV